MSRRLFVYTLALSCAVLASPSGVHAQFSLPGMGSGDDEEPAVRIADPRQALNATRRAIEDRRNGIVLRGPDVEGWKVRQEALAARRLALLARRETLIQKTEPDRTARLYTGRLGAPLPPPVAAPAGDDQAAASDPGDGGVDDGGPGDGGPGDGGPGDGGADDGGPGDGGADDGGASDAGLDGGSGDGGPGDARSADAAPAPPAPPPPPAPKVGTILLPVLPVGDDGFLRVGVHPEELAELDRMLVTLAFFEENLASLMRLHAEESGQLAGALGQLDRLQRLMDKAEQEGEAPEAAPGLQDVERLALDVHLAKIEVSLAQARQRQGLIDDADSAEAVRRRESTLAPMAELDDGNLEPWPPFAESFSRAESLQEEHGRLRREALEGLSPLGRLTERVATARAQRFQLEAQYAEGVLADHKRLYDQALARMTVADKDIERAQRIFERSTKHREKNIPRIEKQLDGLRVTGAGNLVDEVSLFDIARVRQTERSVLAEKLFFERLKLQRDQFRRDLVLAVRSMLDGTKPDPAFATNYADLLDKKRLDARDADRETRCDGWRRKENDVRKEKAPPALVDNEQALLRSYAALADLCMREEWVMGTERRLAAIARYHIKRYTTESRSVWWYVLRGFVSILLAGLLLLISRWLARVTRTLAGRKGGQAAVDPDTTLEGIAVFRRRLSQLRSIFALSLYLGGVVAIWLGVGVLGANTIWDLDVDINQLLGWATVAIFYIGDSEVSLWSLVMLIGFTFLAAWTGRLLQSFAGDLMEHFEVETGLRDTLGTLIRYLAIAVGIAFGLSTVGIGLGALAVFFGVIGIGIGFGLQNIASNFISGFIILLERPIRKGDFIEVDGMVGEVKAIRARATTIETRDAVTVIVPNSEFIIGRVVNWTLGRGERVRGHVTVGAEYGVDVPAVRAALLEVARTHPEVHRVPAPAVQLIAFGDNSVDFKLYFWTDDIRSLPKLQSDLNMAIEAAFREAGIEIPFPQRDLHLRSVPAELLGGAPGREPGEG